ncbi:MAG: NUDIX domain-containing protein [Acidimicrobiales bacterium]
MPKRSAGLLLFRRTNGFEVLLVHPGGPFWARRDEGAWSIPKGEIEGDEEEQAVAAREFTEELGAVPPADGWLDLGEVVQSGGKRVRAWAVEGAFDPDTLISNTFETEWPPRSGRRSTFPEVDRAEWFGADVAASKLVSAQRQFVNRLAEVLLSR